jgi:hypothetical protein
MMGNIFSFGINVPVPGLSREPFVLAMLVFQLLLRLPSMHFTQSHYILKFTKYSMVATNGNSQHLRRWGK